MRSVVASIKSLFLSAIVLAFSICGPAPVAVAATYILGPEDKLRVQVDEWRPATGEDFEWKALSVEASVGADGDLILPLIGRIAAAGRGPGQLADEIGKSLQHKLGLANQPTAAVEIVQYRPIYIDGIVAKPGAYPYSPDMTVQKAISLAGGAKRAGDEEEMQLENARISAQGELARLQIEQVGQRELKARLEAEIDLKPEIAFPPAPTDPALARTAALARQREAAGFALAHALDAAAQEDVRQSEARVRQSIDAMNQKKQSLASQYAVASTQLTKMRELASKGVVVAEQVMTAMQSAGQLQTQMLENDIAVLRAQQDMAVARREAQRVVDRRREDDLQLLRQTDDKLADDAARVALQKDLADQAQGSVLEVGLRARQHFIYTITRHSNGEFKTLIVGGTDDVLPGDTLAVTLDREQATSER